MPNQKYPPEEKCIDMLPKTPGSRTPLISYFHGIFIRMRFGGEQRLHAEYGEDKAAFDFDGNILEGTFPAKQRMYVAVWADLRRTELIVLWELMRTEEAYFNIRGLD
jgi:hypothetical protein